MGDARWARRERGASEEQCGKKKAVVRKNHRRELKAESRKPEAGSRKPEAGSEFYAASSTGSGSRTLATFKSLTIPIALKSFSVIQDMSNSYHARP